MRKISANLILPVSSPPLRNGIIYINPDGSIADLINTGGKLREEAGLEFYPGTITPGFILPWFRLDEYSGYSSNFKPDGTGKPPETGSLSPNVSLIKKLEHELLKNGIKGIGLVLPESMVSPGGFELMGKSSLFFHPVIELCPQRNEDEFVVFNRGIDLVSLAWNEFNLSCSLTACSPAMHYSDIGKFIDEYGRSHKNMVPPEGNSSPLLDNSNPPQENLLSGDENFVPPEGKKSPEENSFNLLKKSLIRNPDMNFNELILNLTRDAAAKIFEEDELGMIEVGKKPGLNLISGYTGPDSGQGSEGVPGYDSGHSTETDENSGINNKWDISLKVLT